MQASVFSTSFGSFGLPPDGVAWVAAACAALCVLFSFRPARAKAGEAPEPGLERAALSRRWALPTLMLCAGLLSFGYAAYYLGGAPRIIDATSYWLAAESFASGQSSFSVPDPSANFRGRFLLPSADGSALNVIFPPGYSALLSVFLLARAPWLLGPALAALLVGLTYQAAKLLFPASPRVWWLAAGLSCLSASLRYHTADSMSHALCACLYLGGLCLGLLALRAGAAPPSDAQRGPESTSRPRLSHVFLYKNKKRACYWLLAGLCLAALVTTRPMSGVVLGSLLLSLLIRQYFLERNTKPAEASREPSSPPTRPLGGLLLAGVLLAAGSLPGIIGFYSYGWHITGEPGGSPQLAYYALADGPEGCFGYGFGAKGCRFEHGEFVEYHLPDGYGLVEAAKTTGRRLKAHLIDSGNFPLFTLALPWLVWRGRRAPNIRLLGLGVLLQPLVYAPFYFDGNYPGGGARMLVDAVPLEHLILAWGFSSWRRPWLAPALALFGFATHASFEHRQLAEREGGQPMFPSYPLNPLKQRPQLGAQELTAPPSPNQFSLVFVDTDHGFNLGHRPSVFLKWKNAPASVKFAEPGWVVARRSYDAREGLLLEALGGPPAYIYSYDPAGLQKPSWSRFYPTPNPQTRLEAEGDWPLVLVEGGSVYPEWPGEPCVSRSRGLRLAPTPNTGAELRVRFELVAPKPGTYQLSFNSYRTTPTHYLPTETNNVSTYKSSSTGSSSLHAERSPSPPEAESNRPAWTLSPLPTGDAAPEPHWRSDRIAPLGACLRQAGPRLEFPHAEGRGQLPKRWLDLSTSRADLGVDFWELTPVP